MPDLIFLAHTPALRLHDVNQGFFYLLTCNYISPHAFIPVCKSLTKMNGFAISIMILCSNSSEVNANHKSLYNKTGIPVSTTQQTKALNTFLNEYNLS